MQIVSWQTTACLCSLLWTMPRMSVSWHIEDILTRVMCSVMYTDRVMTHYCVFVQPTSDNDTHGFVVTYSWHTNACHVEYDVHRLCREVGMLHISLHRELNICNQKRPDPCELKRHPAHMEWKKTLQKNEMKRKEMKWKETHRRAQTCAQRTNKLHMWNQKRHTFVLPR